MGYPRPEACSPAIRQQYPAGASAPPTRRPAPASTSATSSRSGSDGYQGVPAYEGNQFAEINGYVAGTLYQEMLTTPGQTMLWQFAHRGRSRAPTSWPSRSGRRAPPLQQTTRHRRHQAWTLYKRQLHGARRPDHYPLRVRGNQLHRRQPRSATSSTPSTSACPATSATRPTPTARPRPPTAPTT